jgi:hypothetical protein
MHGSRGLPGDAKQRGARVKNGATVAIGTILEYRIADSDLLYLHLPVPKVRQRNWCPLNIRRGLVLVVASKSDHAFTIFVLGKEDGELWQHVGILQKHLTKETELGLEPEGIQAETHDSIKCKMAEWVFCHFGGQDHPHGDAACCGTSKANFVLDELTSHLASAERDDDLVAFLVVDI